MNSVVCGKVRILAKAFPTVTAFTGTCYTVYPSVIHHKARVLKNLPHLVNSLSHAEEVSIVCDRPPHICYRKLGCPQGGTVHAEQGISLSESFPTFITRREPFSSVSFLMPDTKEPSYERFSHLGHLQGCSAVWILWCLGIPFLWLNVSHIHCIHNIHLH